MNITWIFVAYVLGTTPIDVKLMDVKTVVCFSKENEGVWNATATFKSAYTDLKTKTAPGNNEQNAFDYRYFCLSYRQ